MTLPKEKQASHKIEKEQLIQNIRKLNPDIPRKQLDKYDIDDLRKIENAQMPQREKTQDLTVDEIYRQEKRLGTFPQKMQYGGMADMSAAPMVQPRKKKKQQSGFRTKYSKGGGVRSAKYKV